MAAGLSLKEENVEAFRKKINELCTLSEEELARKIVIDVPMPIAYVNSRLVQELSLLEPFGKGNTKPLFAQKGLQVIGGKLLGKNQNVARVQLRDASGYTADAVYFGEAAGFLDFAGKHDQISVTYYPELNRYQGRESLQMVIKNYC
jgi:single-stranded-DNA-specific exonuclease